MKKLTFGLSILLLMAFASTSNALTVYYDDDGTVWDTAALTNYHTTGGMMEGMTVTVTYKDDTTSTAYWADTLLPNYTGQASADNWTLKESFDTYDHLWTLTGDSDIQSVFIDAGTGNTVFDVEPNVEGTAGSSFGKEFTLYSSWLSPAYSGALDVTYSGQVALTGDDPVGDLYRYMFIDFGDEGFTGDTLKFYADTDNLSLPNDIQSSDPVPEPATMFLLGAGLLGMVGARRKKK